jgi:hypothetical protein
MYMAAPFVPVIKCHDIYPAMSLPLTSLHINLNRISRTCPHKILLAPLGQVNQSKLLTTHSHRESLAIHIGNRPIT